MNKNERPSVSDSPWRRLRDLEAPLGSERRVILQAQHEIQAATPAPWRPSLALLGFAGVSVVLLWVFVSGNGAETGSTSVRHSVASAKPPVSSPNADTRAPAAVTEKSKVTPDKPLSPTLSIPAGDSTAIQLADASLDVVGPTNLVLVPEGVRIRHGHVKIAGDARILGPQCEVFVHGNASASVEGEVLTVKVLSGTANSNDANCKVVYVKTTLLRNSSPPSLPVSPASLSAAPTIAPPLSDTVGRVQRPNRSSNLQQEQVESHSTISAAKIDVAPKQDKASPLRKQIESYKLAHTLLATHPKAALAQLKSFVKTWPTSPLQEEAHADIIHGLIRLGKHADAARRLVTFKTRFPESSYIDRFVRNLEQTQ